VPLALCLLPRLPLLAEDATRPGEVTTPYPTITDLSVDGKIQGDDNLNGVVAVWRRAVGDAEWREGLPLRRIPAGNSGAGTTPAFYWENRRSGSIFDLRPNTEYEIRLRLDDPDGGSSERIVRARTRGVPRPAPGAPVRKANPTNFKEAAASARPGDILLLTPGYYGAFNAAVDGEPGTPIVIRGQRDGPIGSTFHAIYLNNRKHVIIENLTVYGAVDLLGAEEVAIRYCSIHSQFGIIAVLKPGAKNCYIADNTITWVMPWYPAGMGASSIHGGPGNVGEGIQITGPGNVIRHDRVKGFRDCISTMEDRGTCEQISIDIYNNDIEVGADDGVEADFCPGNRRVLRNRLTNCFMGLSSLPSLGGPTYFIRNAMYNITEAPFKFTRGSGGNVVLHNTVVKVGDGLRVPHGPGQYSRSLFRNNLCLGRAGGGRFGRYSSGPGHALHTPESDPTNDFDYNGVGTVGTPSLIQIGPLRFSSPEEARATAALRHLVAVDLSVFEGVEFPNPAVPERKITPLRRKAGSAAIDAGLRLANINDGYRGAAPDLGAYELGQALPHYGPRPQGVDEETAGQYNNRQNR